MTNRGDRKVREWASDRNGDPLTPKDVVELVFALDEDNQDRHDEAMAVITSHISEASVRDERITVLEAWRTESALTCERRVCDLIEKEHKERHDAYVLSLKPRRQSDNDEADYTNKRVIITSASGVEDEVFHSRLVWFFASNLGKLVIFAAGGVCLMIINLIVYGRP